MSSILIDHHNRLGDHLMMNGMVRWHAARHERVGVFSIPKFAAFVRAEFRDLPNVEVVVRETHRDKTLYRIANFFSRRYDRILKVWDVDFETGIPSEYQFYKLGGVPYKEKWDSFHVERDAAREAALAERAHLPGRYVFVHDDARYSIEDARIAAALPLFRAAPGLTDNILDYLGIIENAEEVHVIDSSFMFLIDCAMYDRPDQKLFVHRYARPNAPWNLPILRKDWTILT